MFSDKALRLILDAEGLDQPSEWPGESSGITIGIGYDLGYESNFEIDWSPFLTSDEITRLKTVLGIKGKSAKDKASQFKDIKIKRSDAEQVFNNCTLPRYIKETRGAFPGFDNLPLDAQGVLVSLVFNRGSAMTDNSSEDRRKEMRAIRDILSEETPGVCPFSDLQEIANQIRSMERLWKGTKYTGLVTRREHEAALVESCIVIAKPVSEIEKSVIACGPFEPVSEPEQPEPVSVFQMILDFLLKLFKK